MAARLANSFAESIPATHVSGMPGAARVGGSEIGQNIYEARCTGPKARVRREDERDSASRAVRHALAIFAVLRRPCTRVHERKRRGNAGWNAVSLGTTRRPVEREPKRTASAAPGRQSRWLLRLLRLRSPGGPSCTSLGLQFGLQEGRKPPQQNN